MYVSVRFYLPLFFAAAKLEVSLVVVIFESVRRNAAKVYKQIIFCTKKKMMKLAYEHR